MAPMVDAMEISRWDLSGLTLVTRMLDARGRLKPLPRELLAEPPEPRGLPPSRGLVAAVACPACGGPTLRPAASCGLCSPRPRARPTARMSTGGRRPGGGGAARGKGPMVGARIRYKPTVVKRMAKEEARAGWMMMEEVEEVVQEVECNWGAQVSEGARVKEAMARMVGRRARSMVEERRARSRCVSCDSPLPALMLVTCSRECRRWLRGQMNKEQNIEKRKIATDFKETKILSKSKKTVGSGARVLVQAREGRASGQEKVQVVVEQEVDLKVEQEVQEVVDLDVDRVVDRVVDLVVKQVMDQEVDKKVDQKVEQVGDKGRWVGVCWVGAVPQTGRTTRKKTLRRCEECVKAISSRGAIPLCPACLAASRAMEQEAMACRTMVAPRARTRQAAARIRSTSVARLGITFSSIFKMI